MTIAMHILAVRAQHHTSRIAALQGLFAPVVVIEREQTLLTKALSGDIGKVGAGKNESAEALLALDFTEVRWATGNGGKPYAVFTTSEELVSYFPSAKYGPFITRSTAVGS